ncbi:MAG: TetR family transcriptional regulator [Rhodospirillales bacterium]|nr:TetR family transcriptional regulator [Rhodospirillales bacterium]
MASPTSSMAGAPSGLTRREEAKERRRLELIEATVRSIAKRGFSDTTLADVADIAGLSRGIVNFYFKSKDALFAETLRFLADEYRQAWRKSLAKAGEDPARRLRAMLMVNFEPRIFSRKKIAVWYAFWGEAKSRPAYLAVCEEKDREYREALDACVAAVVDAGKYTLDAMAISRTFDAVTDGFWLDRLTDPHCPPVEEFAAATDLMLSTYFPRHFPRSGA